MYFIASLGNNLINTYIFPSPESAKEREDSKSILITDELPPVCFSTLTIEELRMYEGFENFSDSEAEEAVASLIQLALIIYNYNQQQELI